MVLMKTGYLFLIAVLLSVAALGNSEEVFACSKVFKNYKAATLTSLGCKCYDSIAELVCTEPADTTKLLPIEAADNPHSFNKITILNGKNFSEYIEHLNKGNYLKTKTLEIECQANPNQLSLIAIAKIAVKKLQLTILPAKPDPTSGKITKTEINISELGAELEWLSITNAKLSTRLLFNNEKKNLRVLELIDVELPPKSKEGTDGDDTSVILMDNLDRLKLNRVTNLFKVTVKVEKPCTDSDRKYIDLRENTDMKGFDFSTLNLDKGCKYHIDLSDNGNQFPDLLSSYFPDSKEVARLSKNAKDQIYLIMQGTLQTCTKCLYDFVRPFPDYVHSIQCSFLGTTDSTTTKPYLKELNAEDVKKLGACKNPAAK